MAEATTIKSTKGNKKAYIFAVGRRKSAIARVRLYSDVPADLKWENQDIKKGDMLVNGMPISEYFSGDASRYLYSEPLRVVNAQNKYTFTIKVAGGGKAGQLDALVLGLARALDAMNPDQYHSVLKDKGFLTRDARVRERRKVGMGGKSRRKLQSPKR